MLIVKLKSGLNRVNKRKRYSTKVVDRSLAAMDGLFTPIIQLEMAFAHPLDEKRLAKAVDLTMDAEPLLSCRFVPRIIRPYWEKVEKDRDAVFTLTQSEGEYENFKKKGIDFISGPQINSCLYRTESTDKFVLKISHLVSDAAGVKDIATVLSTIYNRIDHEPDYRPDTNPCNLRSFWQIAKNVPVYAFPRIFLNYLHELIKGHLPYRTHHVPIRKTAEKAGKYITRHIEREELTNMVKYAKRRNATINDVLLTAIFRSLSKTGQWDGKAALRIATTIDLRRYLPKKKAESIANFSSMEMMTYGTEMEDDFESTLAHVVDMVNKRKSSWLGLSTFASTNMGIWGLPFALLNILIKKGLESKACSPNAFDWFTNMGDISTASVDFGGRPSRAWLLPPGCNFPILFYGCSGFNGTLSLSASIMPDDDATNEMVVGQFFDLIFSELPLTAEHESKVKKN